MFIALCAWSFTICFAALSIPSGYERYVHQVRSRIVVHERDLRPRNTTSCKSLSGPFCAITPKRSMDNFSLIDSVVSLKLFHTEKLKVAASNALNEFLNTNIMKDIIRPESLEGRLRLTDVAPMGDNSRVDPQIAVGLPVSMSLQGSWRHNWRAGMDGISGYNVLTMQQMGRIRFDGPALVTSLVVNGKVSVRGRFKKKEQWRADSLDANECKVGSQVFYRTASNVVVTGTILLYEQNVVYIHDRISGVTDTRYRTEIAGLFGENCERVQSVERRPEEVIHRSMEFVDEIFFFGDEEIDVVELRLLAPKQRERIPQRENFLVVLPNHHIQKVELSIFAPMWTVDDLEQHDMDLNETKVLIPATTSHEIKVIGNRQFDHVMLSMEESATKDAVVTGFPFGAAKKIVAETQILRDFVKTDLSHHAIMPSHWEIYFNNALEMTGFDYLPSFVKKLPNTHAPTTWLKKRLMLVGKYQCGVGSATRFSMRFTTVSKTSVMAEFSFTLDGKNGVYLVEGSLKGRVLTLKPVKDSWSKRPQGFSSIGVIGVLSKTPSKVLVFEGSLLATGCGPFRATDDEDDDDDDDEDAMAAIGVSKVKKRPFARNSSGRRAVKLSKKADDGILSEEAVNQQLHKRCSKSVDIEQCVHWLRAIDDLRALRSQYRTNPPEQEQRAADIGKAIKIDLADLQSSGGLIEKLAKMLSSSEP
eukprot:GEMP01009701.1.p1 GENE.GEMP01009701.1~~GEMP01009701.1.p1  ORF type:complete len:727 (+),score=113.90 GEMP01009701.1:80-2182(+)